MRMVREYTSHFPQANAANGSGKLLIVVSAQHRTVTPLPLRNSTKFKARTALTS
jgi:hypothetical protein